MPHYFLRVELKGRPTRDTYHKLNALLEQQGFTQTIKGVHRESRKPVTSDLPHGTFAGESNLCLEVLTEMLAKAVKTSIQPKVAMALVRYDQWQTTIDSQGFPSLPRRVLVTYWHRIVWNVRCLAPDGQTVISPRLEFPNYRALLQVLRVSGASDENVAETEARIKRCRPGSLWVDVNGKGRKLLRLSL